MELEAAVIPPRRLFKRSRTYDFSIPTADGRKVVVVRFPTDEEWCLRARRLTAVRRSLGRDVTQMEFKDEYPLSKELVQKILEGDSRGIDIDEWTAHRIVSELIQCEIAPENKEVSNVYHIDMRVFGEIAVTHRLRTPTQRQILEYQRATLNSIGRRNAMEYKTPLEPSGELWDKLSDGVEGYDNLGSVSILHKDVAVKEVIEQINAEIHKAVISPEE
jgi:hypothetical protein